MKYIKIRKCDVANGPGVRVTIFVSGCNHHCKGCFNSESWDFNYGYDYTKEQEDQIIEYLKPDHIEGLTLLGGEPFEEVNRAGLVPLIKRVRKEYPNKDIWCFTGFKLDEQIIGEMIEKENSETAKEMLNNIDYLVDGRFMLELKDPKLRFRGSSNQRIINVKETLKQNKIILWDEFEENKFNQNAV